MANWKWWFAWYPVELLVEKAGPPRYMVIEWVWLRWVKRKRSDTKQFYINEHFIRSSFHPWEYDHG